MLQHTLVNFELLTLNPPPAPTKHLERVQKENHHTEQ